MKILWLFLFLLVSCAVPIRDVQMCSPIPEIGGAACDNLLTRNQIILDQAGWEALQGAWAAQGKAVECTSSQSISDLKGALEKLCSVYRCSFQPSQ